MNAKDARAAHDNLIRRRALVTGLLDETRAKLETLLEAAQKPDADPRDLVQVQLLAFQGHVLVQVMERLADEAAALALTLGRPSISTNEIKIPDTLPEEL